MPNFSIARLRGHRNGRRMSQDDVALPCGLSVEDYDSIEAGATKPDETLVNALAKALDVPPADLEGSGTYEHDYIAAVLQHAPPLTPEQVQHAAEALLGLRTA